MTDDEKIQQALQLVIEVKADTEDDPMLQQIIESQISALENLKKWLKNRKVKV